jgi:hypothetical protein
VFANHLLVRRDVHAVDLVAGHVAGHPLNLRAELGEDAARLLGDPLKLSRDSFPAPGMSRSITYFGRVFPLSGHKKATHRVGPARAPRVKVSRPTPALTLGSARLKQREGERGHRDRLPDPSHPAPVGGLTSSSSPSFVARDAGFTRQWYNLSGSSSSTLILAPRAPE